MSSQKALVLTAKQGDWEVRDVAIATPGPTDVLVKIISTALNPVDWKIQKYGFLDNEYPFILGTDAAGTIEEVGAEVTNVVKGDDMYVCLLTIRRESTIEFLMPYIDSQCLPRLFQEPTRDLPAVLHCSCGDHCKGEA